MVYGERRVTQLGLNRYTLPLSQGRFANGRLLADPNRQGIVLFDVGSVHGCHSLNSVLLADKHKTHKYFIPKLIL